MSSSSTSTSTSAKDVMIEDTTETGIDIDALAAAVTSQGAKVRTLKKENTGSEILQAEIAKLKDLKSQLEKAKKIEEEKNASTKFNRVAFDTMVIRKMFVVPAFEIHGGVSGLFDLGPPSCAVKANMLAIWRSHFILEENMLEMECTNLTPAPVLQTSGHVEKFTDLMVKDVKTGECYRADKLLEDHIEQMIEDPKSQLTTEEKQEHSRIARQADAFSPKELDEILKRYNIKAPLSGNDLSEPYPFNLMFQTSIGPEGTSVGYLRPETAQGLFVNFRRLIEYNSGKMPFAAAQIGTGFRNEIAPRGGLLRVREFCMAEIEHFVDPEDKTHPKFASIADTKLTLFTAENQLGSGKTIVMTVGEAVGSGIINNETLGYFMTKTYNFMKKIGMDITRTRFRQHLTTEMAHYAADCWDLEIKGSYGWIECVGHADRACYDLKVHSEKTNTPLVAARLLNPPKQVDYYKLIAEKRIIGKTFKKDQKQVITALETIGEDLESCEAFMQELNTNGVAKVCDGAFEVTKEMCSFERTQKTVTEEKYYPSVIEPSFGIGRILYHLLEHSFYQRKKDEQRTVMAFNANIAPIKLALTYTGLKFEEVSGFINELQETLTKLSISYKLDSSSTSIGRRYARADEIGIPFCLVVDADTLRDKTVTLRERDDMSQIRLAIAEAPSVIQDLIRGDKSWDECMKIYPIFKEGGEDNLED